MSVDQIPLRRTTWTKPSPRERCNFHPQRPATHVFAGTPLCRECADRIGPPPRAAAPG